MDNTLLMIFTGVLALAVLLQSIVFFLIHRSIRQLNVRTDSLGKDLLRNAEMVSAKVNEGVGAIKAVAEDVKPITTTLVDTVHIVHRRVQEVDAFISETTGTARLEILRIQETIHDASRRAQETIDLLRSGILAPLQEINAITRAIRVAVDVLFRRRRNPSEISAQDEEMFI